MRQLREVWPNSSLCNFGPFFAVAFPHKDLFGLRPIRKEGPGPWYKQIFHDTVDQYTALMMGHEPPATRTTDAAGADRPNLWTLGANALGTGHRNGVFQPPLFPSDLGRPNSPGLKGAA